MGRFVLAAWVLCVATGLQPHQARHWQRSRGPSPCGAGVGGTVADLALLRGRWVPAEAVVALVYAAPLPPLGATLRRVGRAVRGGGDEDEAREVVAAAPRRGAFASGYVLLLLSYALRDATAPSKVAFLYAGLRLSAQGTGSLSL